MNKNFVTLGKRLAGFLVLAWCFACGPPRTASIEDVAAQWVPGLRLGMPLDSATRVLTDVKAVDYWGYIGHVPGVQNFPRIGVRTSSARQGAERVTEIHMFSPSREIVPRVVQAVSSATHITPTERCTGGDRQIIVYEWQVERGRILLTDNKTAVPGADPVHLWFVTPETDRPLTYPVERCR